MSPKWRFLIFKNLIAAVWLCVLLLPGAVQAQSQIRFASLNVDLLPEYDQPAVLVIYQISLAPDTSLPAQLSLHIPVNAQIWAVAVADATGTLVDATYTNQLQGDLAQLSLTTDSLSIHIEYYDTLVKNGTARHIVYKWLGDYSVDALTVDFQVPVGATDLAFTPATVQSTTDLGFTHYRTAVMSLAAGQTFSLTGDYQKQTDDLSVKTIQGTATPTLPQSTFGSFWADNQEIILVSLLAGLVLIGALISLIFWQRSRTHTIPRKRHPHPAATGKIPKGAVYCSQCGERAHLGDAFCRACGARLRRIN